eukprot:CAMPEP_0194228308 /NCGR_PEP_ID=MMETSP0156-20130528/43301_1 /TAXON_ID=33649 /ORGANISM="Thalassionema nitzschioides, Strain L26-B" /LENGTH=493 /DNA_ID=CAMNT_0038960819 /DNA_START=124 /DNA_END=1603 /DNA_ORIENTATION=+
MSSASAQVDVSAGSYSCYPCGRALCGFADGGGNTLIDPIGQGFGQHVLRDIKPLTCNEIQRKADNRELDQEECSLFSSVTRGPDDPCRCEERLQAFTTYTTGNDCVDPAQPSECNLCGRNKVIGDPERIIPDPMFPVSCANLYDSQRENIQNGNGGYSGQICSDLQVLFGRHCQCVEPSDLSTVKTCIPQEDIHGEICEKDKDCCVGHCRYIHAWKSHGLVCTHRADESHLMPAGWTNPTPATPEPEIINQAPPGGIIGQAPPAPAQSAWQSAGFGCFSGSTLVHRQSEEDTENGSRWTVQSAGFGCFSGSTLVHRQSEVGHREWVSLDRVEIGDVIEVAKDKFEPIYAFGHINPDEEGSYMELNFDQEQEPLQITEEHLIWTLNKGAVPAGSLKVGQEVVLAGGYATTVTSMQMKTSKGVYAPFTPSGTLVLNHGIMASSYVSLTTYTRLPLIPSAYHHLIAHFFTFPHRFSCHYQSTCPNATYTEEGINVW